jgi:DNA-binding CsgD family transcriptional regulator
LLRQLLASLEPTTPAAMPPVDGGSAVFDVQVDGRRYTLIRGEVPAAVEPFPLSPREKEVVRLVAKGLSNKVIAQVLDISVWTVSTHLRRIFAKLNVNSRAEMVARSLTDGLLPGNGVHPAADADERPHPHARD